MAASVTVDKASLTILVTLLMMRTGHNLVRRSNNRNSDSCCLLPVSAVAGPKEKEDEEARRGKRVRIRKRAHKSSQPLQKTGDGIFRSFTQGTSGIHLHVLPYRQVSSIFVFFSQIHPGAPQQSELKYHQHHVSLCLDYFCFIFVPAVTCFTEVRPGTQWMFVKCFTAPLLCFALLCLILPSSSSLHALCLSR